MHSIAKIQSCILREAETWLACKLDLENHFIVYRITPNKYLTTHKNSLVNILYHTKIPQTGKKTMKVITTVALLLLISIYVCSIWARTSDELRLTLPNGNRLIGTSMRSTNGRLIKAFEGVPYAKPPLGKRRFKVRTRVFYDMFAICIFHFFCQFFFLHFFHFYFFFCFLP